MRRLVHAGAGSRPRVEALGSGPRFGNAASSPPASHRCKCPAQALDRQPGPPTIIHGASISCHGARATRGRMKSASISHQVGRSPTVGSERPPPIARESDVRREVVAHGGCRVHSASGPPSRSWVCATPTALPVRAVRETTAPATKQSPGAERHAVSLPARSSRPQPRSRDACNGR